MADVRLIDANALASYFLQLHLLVKDAQTIDAVPVVRCRECVHNEDEDVCPFFRVNRGKNWLEIIKPHPDGFCYMGKKMDGGAEP